MSTIGFIGLGHMGSLMQANLVKAGHKVMVYDVVPAAVRAAIENGATAASSVAALAQTANLIFLSVQTTQQVEILCKEPDGIFAHAEPNTLIVDCSSIDIQMSRQLAEMAQAQGLQMLDAPVSGGVAGAKAGTLTFMVGGEKAAFERALPLLQNMGKKIVHAGGAGCGQAAKICNNMLLGISMIGVAESFNLAKKLGLEPKQFFEISSNASGQCWAMTSYCPVPNIIPNVPSNQNYEPGFAAKMMLKDLRLAHHAAESVDVTIPLGAMAAELYELYVSQGNSDKDFSGIINLFGSTSD